MTAVKTAPFEDFLIKNSNRLILKMYSKSLTMQLRMLRRKRSITISQSGDKGNNLILIKHLKFRVTITICKYN